MSSASKREPFIAHQPLRLLRELAHPGPYLKPGYFRVRRVDAAEGAVASGPPESRWVPVPREQVLANTVPDCDLGRMVLVAQPGMGVPTFLRSWQARISAPGSLTLAFLLDVAELPANPEDVLRGTLVDQLRQAEGNSPEFLSQERAEQLLDRLRRQGRLVLFFDGLLSVAEKRKLFVWA